MKKEAALGGKEDLFVDKDGNIFAGKKGGSGEAASLGEDIDDFL